MKENKNKNKWIKLTIIIMILGLNIYTIFFYINRTKDENKTKSLIDEINNTKIKLEDNNKKTNTKTENEIIKEKITNAKNINNETIGWLKVNNTSIDYPFVKGKDNDFYLNHSLDKTKNAGGWAFLDYRNNSYMTSKASIIYAHNRLTGTMFGTLKNLLKVKDNNYIYIYTQDKKLTYQVFSTYTTKKENYYLTKYFKDNKEFLDFANTIKKRSNYNYNIDLKETDKILTLSTCSGTSNRLAVHAVLIKEEEI